MVKLQIPEFGLLSEEDWSFFLDFDPEQYILTIDESLRLYNRFFVDNRFNKLLNYYTTNEKAIKEFEFIIPEHKELYRARIYDCLDAEEKAKNAKDGKFNGYNKEDSFVPPSNIHCRQGRINPDGIIYLYLSSTAECAIQEVTPAPSNWVSVAKIVFLESVRIFDMAKSCLTGVFSDKKKSNWAMKIMSSLSSLFSRPYREVGDYLICQYVSEFIKNTGYDGIRFFSSRVLQKFNEESYVNYTIFNYNNKCEPISSDLLYVFNNNLEILTYEKKESITYNGEVE